MNLFAFLRRLAAVFLLVSTSTVFAQTSLFSDQFKDGSRTDLSAPSSGAWFASSTPTFTNGVGGANGTLALNNGSSRTLVGYCAPTGSPITLPLGETVTLTVTFSVTGAPLTKSNGLIVGLLQSVANSAATTDAANGFTASGSPNTNARVTGDFASSNPASGVFSIYNGYAAWTNLNGTASSIRKRTTANNGLDNSSGAWTQIGSNGAAGTAPVANTTYQAVLTLNRTAGNALNLTYALKQGATTLSSVSVTEATATYTTFDTVNLYMASAVLTATTDSLVISQVDVTTSVIPAVPNINSSPSSQSLNVGATASFTVNASGSGTLTYQWRKDTNAIDTVANPSAATSTLSLSNIQAGDAGSYDCVVSNSSGSTTSAAATLTVNTVIVPPSITTSPADRSVALAGSTTFTVVAAGSSPLTYQWRKDTNAINTVANPSAATASLTLTNLQLSDIASYDCVVTGPGANTATSTAASLTVIPPPSVTVPSGQTVNIGDSTSFSVTASGTGPFTYAWRKNTSAINTVANPSAATASLSLTNIQSSDAANYDVVVTGPGGSTTSTAATLLVNTPASIAVQPASQNATFGSNITLSVTAAGTAPFTYQWRKNTSPINTIANPSAATASLSLTNAQAADAATYDVVVTNAFGTATSNNAILTLAAGLPYSHFNLTGFATLGSGTSGGGIIPETDPAYRKCSTPLEFVTAIRDANKTANLVRVIEITADLNLGWLEIDAATKALTSIPIRSHDKTPKLHPSLIATGVSVLDIVSKNGLTLFSANGSTLKHVTLNIKGTSNIMIRNLRFDEMWEWDEATKGDYDSNDWDFMVLSNGASVSNIWIDHCTFTKAYDGIVDMKKGTQYVTFSWCRYLGDDGATNPNSHVRQQIDLLESNKAAYTFYNFLRTNGFSKEEIIQIIQGHDKAHLMGATELDAENNVLSATFHHQWFQNIWDRCVPRLRGGQVHNYNILVDDSVALIAKRLRDTRANALSTTLKNTLNSTYSFNPFLNGSISTEGAALLVEKSFYQDCLTPLRNNQTDVNNPTYTGKIKSLDTIYVMHNADATTTMLRGDSTDVGNPMGPLQATIIPFSWNTSDGSRPYSAPPMDDPANLPTILNAGAGAGRLFWSKDNWLKTSYADTAPVILTQPIALTAAVGTSPSLTVVAAGPGTLTYQWRKNSAPIDTVANPSAATATLFLTSIQLTDTASYDVVVTNAIGPVTSTPAAVTVTQSFTSWATSQGLTAGNSAYTDDPDFDGLTNLYEYAFGTSPLTPTSPAPLIIFTASGSQKIQYTLPTWTTDLTYTLQTSLDLIAWAPPAPTATIESSTATTATYSLTLPAGQPRTFARILIGTP